MRLVKRILAVLLMAGVVSAGGAALSPADACVDGKCGGCKVRLDLNRPIDCYS